MIDSDGHWFLFPQLERHIDLAQVVYKVELLKVGEGMFDHYIEVILPLSCPSSFLSSQSWFWEYEVLTLSPSLYKLLSHSINWEEGWFQGLVR